MMWPAELAGWRQDGWVQLPSWRTDVPEDRLSACEGAPDFGGRKQLVVPESPAVFVDFDAKKAVNR